MYDAAASVNLERHPSEYSIAATKLLYQRKWILGQEIPGSADMRRVTIFRRESFNLELRNHFNTGRRVCRMVCSCTKSNHEKIASTMLEAKGFRQYLPLYRVRRKWSDRIVEATLPLFPGYVFCQFVGTVRTPVVSTPGVVSIVGFGGIPAPIPEHEIRAVENILLSGLAAEPCPFIREGQRVRVKSGALQGLEGLLVKKKSACRVVVSVEMLQRSIAVEVDPESVVAA